MLIIKLLIIIIIVTINLKELEDSEIDKCSSKKILLMLNNLIIIV